MKITGGFLKNHSIVAPKGNVTRPTSEKLRQSVFNICQGLIEEGDFLDCFAGSGAMGIEAISRGAKSATFIENHPTALKALKDNLSRLNISSLATVVRGDVLTQLKRLKGTSYQIIYVDPPYEKGLQEKTLLLIDSLKLLHTGGILFVEGSHSRPLLFPEFTRIKLKKQRKMGSSTLYEFIG
ncbi:MAG: 16S rRNA (guanine(966)-N(2))-methyltransferase RsmD [Chlamydiia bacterium]|nr:16S rRNA (guanine(966)-N(2))-methyltransferase RsmD [Chlamydiia bacterium]